MLEEIKDAPKVAGIKQSTRAVKDGKARIVLIADDADRRVTQQLEGLCKQESIEIIRVNTMKELGDACNINVSAAVAVILKTI